MKNILILKILAWVALLFSFADMPKGYYQLLRWTVCAAAIGAIWENANSSRSEGWKTFVMFFFGAMAITFNPILPIHFDRDVWEVLDIVALIGLAASAFFRPPQ
ncbi:MAG TPA: DUF6804 family protein [Chthoniobacteraceae bacterium]|nr:DUF6804 family protein [Chthoniobacteraceae bacterium]